MDGGAWWAAVHGVMKSQTWLSDFTFIFQFHALEKEMATHCSVLAWRTSGTGEPGGLPSMGSWRVRHDWSDLAAAAVINLLVVSHMTQWGSFGVSSSSCEGSNHSVGALPAWLYLSLISFHSFCLLTPSHWELGLQHMSLGAGKHNKQSIVTPCAFWRLLPVWPRSCHLTWAFSSVKWRSYFIFSYGSCENEVWHFWSA